jgi:hypothetical protein
MVILPTLTLCSDSLKFKCYLLIPDLSIISVDNALEELTSPTSGSVDDRLGCETSFYGDLTAFML